MKILCIGTLLIFSSCATLIKNQGFKDYSSPIAKTDEYKRSNKYQQDLLYLNDLCENSFPDIEKVFPEKERKAVLDSLLQLLASPAVDENTFAGYARFYLAHFENQHTTITGLSSNMLFPYNLYPVEESWYLWDINSGYDSLLIGKQVISLNSMPIAEIEKQLFKYVFAENEINKRHSTSRLINRPDILQQFGIIRQTDSIRLGFEQGQEVWVRSITSDEDLKFYLGEKRYNSHPLSKRIDHNYHMELNPFGNFAYLQFNKCHDEIDSYETVQEYLKPWAIPFAKRYIKRQIKRKDAIKLRGLIDVDRPVFKDYLQVMFDSIHHSSIKNLIIDLRHNPGGSSLLCLQLLYYLTERTDVSDFSKMYYLSEFNRQTDPEEYRKFIESYEQKHSTSPRKGRVHSYGFLHCDSLLFEKIENPESPYHIPKDRNVFDGKIIVLANFGTGSAAALFTTLLQDNELAVIVGTSVGNNAIGPTHYQPYRLPNTKFSGSIATGYIVRPDPDKGVVQMPDYWVENTVDDMINANDQLLRKALELIEAQ